jgi:hypothetical protein
MGVYSDNSFANTFQIEAERNERISEREKQGEAQRYADPSRTLASISRAQWHNFVTLYDPVEQQALRESSNERLKPEGDFASQVAGTMFSRGQDQGQRNLQRVGVSLNMAERKSTNRRNNLAKATTVAGTENTFRREGRNRNTNARADLIGIGRGVARSATDGLDAAASASAARESNFQAQKDAQRQQQVAMATTAAMAIIAFA